MTLVALLAAPKIPEGEGPEWGKAAPVGLLVILLLCVAFWLLLRSMTKHLRKVRESAAAQAPSGGTVPGTGDDADSTDAGTDSEASVTGPPDARADEAPTDADATDPAAGVTAKTSGETS